MVQNKGRIRYLIIEGFVGLLLLRPHISDFLGIRRTLNLAARCVPLGLESARHSVLCMRALPFSFFGGATGCCIGELGRQRRLPNFVINCR